MSDVKKQILENFGKLLEKTDAEEDKCFLIYSEGALAVKRLSEKPQDAQDVQPTAQAKSA